MGMSDEPQDPAPVEAKGEPAWYESKLLAVGILLLLVWLIAGGSMPGGSGVLLAVAGAGCLLVYGIRWAVHGRR